MKLFLIFAILILSITTRHLAFLKRNKGLEEELAALEQMTDDQLKAIDIGFFKAFYKDNNNSDVRTFSYNVSQMSVWKKFLKIILESILSNPDYNNYSNKPKYQYQHFIVYNKELEKLFNKLIEELLDEDNHYFDEELELAQNFEHNHFDLKSFVKNVNLFKFLSMTFFIDVWD